MREWGLVPDDVLERIVVVSPHLDDAVLGCGRLLAAHPGATVVTVYAGRAGELSRSADALGHGLRLRAGRRRARRPQASRTGARSACSMRPPCGSTTSSTSTSTSPTGSVPTRPSAGLEAAIRAADPTAVFMPFGLANPDHTATHDAARLVRERMPEPAWFCYEDMGYQHIPGLLAWRVAQLFRAEIWPTPAAPTVDPGHERKQAAVAHYGSQLRALEADWQIGAKLAAPAPEQFWSLDPPPTGWERLTATV